MSRDLRCSSTLTERTTSDVRVNRFLVRHRLKTMSSHFPTLPHRRPASSRSRLASLGEDHFALQTLTTASCIPYSTKHSHETFPHFSRRIWRQGCIIFATHSLPSRRSPSLSVIVRLSRSPDDERRERSFRTRFFARRDSSFLLSSVVSVSTCSTSRTCCTHDCFASLAVSMFCIDRSLLFTLVSDPTSPALSPRPSDHRDSVSL